MNQSRKARLIKCLTNVNQDGALTTVIASLKNTPNTAFDDDYHLSIIIGNIALDERFAKKLINNPELKQLCDQISVANPKPRLNK